MSGRAKGFTLVELLVVVAIVGVLAAISVPAMQVALDKGRQRTTMAGMRGIGAGISLYEVDNSFFPSDGIDAGTLVSVIAPHTKIQLPSTDTWTHSYGYHSNSFNWYSLESFGRDGIDGVNITYATRLDFDLDLVLSTGQFSSAPE